MSEEKEKQIRVKWGSDDDLPALYANQMFISHSGNNEFHVVFGHLSPPITIGLAEDELPDFVEIKPLAKIIISPEAMGEFMKALNENYERFLEKRKEDEK